MPTLVTLPGWTILSKSNQQSSMKHAIVVTPDKNDTVATVWLCDYDIIF